MNLEAIEHRFRDIVARVPAEDRAYLIQVLNRRRRLSPRGDRQRHTSGLAPATVELLIDAEEEPALRAVLVGILREQG